MFISRAKVEFFQWPNSVVTWVTWAVCLSKSIPCTVRLSWLENAYSRPLFLWAILTCKVVKTDLVFVCDQGSVVGLCVQHYKSLYAAVMICATLVNVQTYMHWQHFDQLIWIVQPAELKNARALMSGHSRQMVVYCLHATTISTKNKEWSILNNNRMCRSSVQAQSCKWASKTESETTAGGTCAGNSAAERWQASSDTGTAYPTGSTGQQMSNSYQPQRQQRSSFSALPVAMSNSDEVSLPPQPRSNNSSDPYRTVPGSFVDRGRFTDSASAVLNPSITDADKLQQQGHENLTHCYRGDGYRGERFPSRYLFEEMVDHNFQNVGRYPVERSANFQPYFHGDTSSSSAAASEATSYSRRVPWSDSTRSQLQSQVIFS